MSITLLSNIASLRAQRQLSNSSDQLSKVAERLSSGLRINSASDDAAGLAISDSLRAQSRIASVAIRNANDGISALTITDTSLGQISNVLQRLAELAEQSANGVYKNTQRSAIQNEFVALASEIERIASVTKFNNIALLSGANSLSIQVGFDSGSNSQIMINAVQGTLSSLFLAGQGSSALTYSLIGATEADSQNAARTALAAVQTAISEVSSRRGAVGATSNRLDVAVSNLQTTRENFISAESRIRDADVAQETANYVRLQILQNAGVAILTQANLQPSLALRLLQVG